MSIYTDAEIRVREQVWSAARAGVSLELTPEALRLLQSSILKAGLEIVRLRDEIEHVSVAEAAS